MPPRQHSHRPPAERGSVLIVALLVAALIAIALASYLNLNLSSTRLAKRTFNGYAALNLAEAGVEEGVWSFNRAAIADPDAWSAWNNDTSAAWMKLPSFDLLGNATGSVKVYVDNYRPLSNQQPKVVAQASVSAPGEPPQAKMVEVTLHRRSYFAGGLVAKDSVLFNGTNVSVDSWNSDPDNNPGTPPIDYSAATRTDHGSVASTSFLNASVAVNQANVWGYVATGGAAPQVGSQGTIRGASTAANVKVDASRVSTDFNASFAVVQAPSDGTPIASVGATLGTVGTTTKWRCAAVSLNGNDTLTVNGRVILVLTAGAGTPALSVTGNAAIIVPAGSNFTIYTDGDIKVAGRGIANINIQPISLQIWGTSKSRFPQAIEVLGMGALRGVVYAANGDVKIAGNGDVMGSVVALTITLVGNAAFHYDESLANYGPDTAFGPVKWRELTTAADRARYTDTFNGW